MPHKSQRRRGKHSAQSKKRKSRLDSSVTVAQQQAVAQDYKSISQAPTPSAKVLTAKSILPPVQHPYITIELRRIALLAGIMLTVLVVLHFVIP